MIAAAWTALARLASLPFSIIILMMLSVLLIGSDVVYGVQSSAMFPVMVVYALLWVMSRQELKGTQHRPMNIRKAFPAFIISFIATAFVMMMVGPMLAGLILASTLEAGIEFIIVFGLMQTFVKAYIEEEFFRGRLAAKIGDIGQALMFGLFHFFILYAVFGFSWMLFGAMGWLTLLGYIWGRLEDVAGIEGSTGSHWGYNLAALGMLPFVTGMVVV